jgi:hypothetical protein
MSSKGVTHAVGVPPPLVIRLENDVVRRLRPAAARRDLNVQALVVALLDAIAEDGLIDAVLDDASSEQRR